MAPLDLPTEVIKDQLLDPATSREPTRLVRPPPDPLAARAVQGALHLPGGRGSVIDPQYFSQDFWAQSSSKRGPPWNCWRSNLATLHSKSTVVLGLLTLTKLSFKDGGIVGDCWMSPLYPTLPTQDHLLIS